MKAGQFANVIQASVHLQGTVQTKSALSNEGLASPVATSSFFCVHRVVQEALPDLWFSFFKSSQTEPFHQINDSRWK